jgi:hypothetical protein
LSILNPQSSILDPRSSSDTLPSSTPDPRPSSTPAASHFTRANFDKIKKGMTEEQVRAILGSPTDITYKTDTAKDKSRFLKSLEWTQLNPKATIEIELIDGLVEKKTTTLPAPPPPPPKPNPNDEVAGLSLRRRVNYPLIKFGITEDEVLDLLGPGPAPETHIEKGTINGSPYNLKTLSWKYYIPNPVVPSSVIHP